MARDYLSYEVKRVRDFVTGKTACATSTGPPQVVQLHAPFEVQVIGFSMSCYGDWPEIPDPTSLESKMVLLDGMQEMTQVMTDGANSIFHVMGAYFYVNTLPDGLSADMSVGVMPDTILSQRLQGVFKKENLRNILEGIGVSTVIPTVPPVFQSAIVAPP